MSDDGSVNVGASLFLITFVVGCAAAPRRRAPARVAARGRAACRAVARAPVPIRVAESGFDRFAPLAPRRGDERACSVASAAADGSRFRDSCSRPARAHSYHGSCRQTGQCGWSLSPRRSLRHRCARLEAQAPPPTPGAHGARAAARGQLLVNWVFFQVSVAILLDNFLAASNALKMEKELRVIQRKQTRKQLKNPLDPLLLRLSKDYTNEADLSKRLRELFKVGRGSARGPQADGGGRLFSGAPLRSCLMQGLPVVRVYRAAGRAVCP